MFKHFGVNNAWYLSRFFYFKLFASFSTVALALLSLLTLFPYARPSHTTYAIIDETIYGLTLATTDNVDIPIDPTSPGAMAIKKHTISSTTNAPSGYRIYVSSATSDSTIYLFGDPNNNQPNRKIIPTSGTYTSPVALSTSPSTPATWGYAVAGLNNFDPTYSETNPDTNAKFASLPSPNSAQLVHSHTGIANNDPTNIYFGVKVSNELNSGDYPISIRYFSLSDISSLINGEANISPTTLPLNYPANQQVIITTSLKTSLNLGEITATINNQPCTNLQITSQSPVTITCTLPTSLPLGSHDVMVNISKFGKSYTITDGLTIQQSYTLNFNANSGSNAPAPLTATSTSPSHTFTLPATIPTRSGFVFQGWATSSSATTPGFVYDATTHTFSPNTITLNSSTPTRTLYAVWAKVYTLNFNANSGSNAPAPLTATSTSPTHTFTLPATIPTRSGYNFKGWATSSSATTPGFVYNANNHTFTPATITLNSSTPTRTLYAVWAKVYTYTLNYHSNGGSNVPSQTASSEATSYTFTFNTNIPTRANFVFKGWANTASATSPNYVYNSGNNTFTPATITLNSSSPTKTLYAVWHCRYTLNFNANSGSNAPAPLTATSTSPTHTFTLPATIPTKSNHTFLGWANSASATIPNYVYNVDHTFTPATITLNSSSPTKTIYAVWSVTFHDAYASAGKDMLNGYYKMQDMTTEICNAVTGYSDNTRAESARLIDIRDNQVYWVAKLKMNQEGTEHKCWMTQNLALLLITTTPLNNTTTDIPATFTPNHSTIVARNANPWAYDDNEYNYPNNHYHRSLIPYCYNTNNQPYSKMYIIPDNSHPNYGTITDSQGCIRTGLSQEECEHYSTGVYYNSLSAIPGSFAANPYYNYDQSICPANWRLPIGRTGPDSLSEFSKLANAYTAGGIHNLTVAPLWFVVGGMIKYPPYKPPYPFPIPSFFNRAQYGYYFTSTSLGYSQATPLAIEINWFDVIHSFSSGQIYLRQGANIRCLAR